MLSQNAAAERRGAIHHASIELATQFLPECCDQRRAVRAGRLETDVEGLLTARRGVTAGKGNAVRITQIKTEARMPVAARLAGKTRRADALLA